MEREEALQQKLEHWCAVSVRALSNEPSVYFRGHHLVVREAPYLFQSPYLHLDFKTHDERKLRGVADGMALRLVLSDSELHDGLKPDSTIEALVFEILEQLRVESLTPASLPGMRTNLRLRFLFWARQAAASKLVENSIGLLLFTINVVCWSRLLKEPIPEEIEDVIESTRWGFSESLKHYLYVFSRHGSDQLKYSEHSLAIAQAVGRMIDQEASGDDKESGRDSIRNLLKTQQLNLQWLDIEDSSLQQNYGISEADDIVFLAGEQEYRTFNKAYDKEVNATAVIRGAQLLKFRRHLDRLIRDQSVNAHRVARYLQLSLASPAKSGWRFGEEEGYLDSARLSRVVMSPGERRLFRQEDQIPSADCVVSIVVDNSGSMTHHGERIAVFVDTFAKVLELAQIKTEILGFTTVEWNGGKVAKEWQASGRPKNPGRLTSLNHTVYKKFETPWRRSRTAIAGMLKSELFREGIDGEALEWAVRRIESRPERQKIIVMLSDGSPMDTATVAANSDRYLDFHLAKVARSVESRPDVRLCAIGVGLDLSAYYRENMSISLDDELSTKDYFCIVDLLARAI